MPKKIKSEKKEINPLRVEIGRKGAQSLWGDAPRPRLARISVEDDLGPVVASIPLADRVRITSQALRMGFASMSMMPRK